MFKKGKLKLLPQGIKKRNEIKKIFKDAEEGRADQ
jgi:hypothetical protein